MKNNKLYKVLTFSAFRKYIERLNENFGKDFVLLLISTYLLLKGFLLSLIIFNNLPYFKEVLKVNETKYQIFILIAWTPWSIKALFGSISDLYPLFGYHKKSYMLISAFLGSTAIFLLALLKLNSSTIFLAPALLFLVMFEISFIDLLCEGKYAEIMRINIRTKSDAISWVWGCIMIGSLIASCLVGIFTDHFNAQYLYWVGFPLALQVVIPLFLGYMPEEYIPKGQRKFLTEKYNSQKNLFYLAMIITVFSIAMIFINVFSNATYVFFYSIFTSIVLSISGFIFLPKVLARCNFFLFLTEATYIQIPGALDYWYTASHACVPNGPNFNYTYYLTYTQIFGGFASIIGILIFQLKMINWKFRYCFLISTIIRMIASVFDILIVLRINLKWGIPDKVAYLLGDALIFRTASMLTLMPAVLLTAKSCTAGFESTVYALLAGFQSFGDNISKSIGIALMGFLKIDADSTPCNFKKLPLLILICHTILPIVTIPLVWPLIPNIRANEKIVNNDDNTDQDGRMDNIMDLSTEVELTHNK